MKIQYKTSIIAFIDVLGFSDIVLNDEHSIVENYFTYLLSSLQKLSDYSSLDCYYISDTIIITGDDSEENLYRLVSLVRVLQSELLINKILIRGSISIGDLYINRQKNIIVGRGLINAYKLEKRAIYPRVIVDRKLISHFSLQNTNNFLKSITKFNKTVDNHNFIDVDKDNLIYVNYVSYLCTRQSYYNYDGKKTSKVYELIQNAYFKNSHLDKYSWLLTKIIFEMEKQLISMEYFENKSAKSTRQRLRLINRMPSWLDRFKLI